MSNKSVDFFKKNIQEYLEHRSANDELFAITYKKENKNIDDCAKYIINEVQKSKRIAFENDEIYSLAVHYYDEDDIVINDNKITGVDIVSPGTYIPTEEDKIEAKQKAITGLIDEERSKMKSKTNKKIEEHPTAIQSTLFNFDETEE